MVPKITQPKEIEMRVPLLMSYTLLVGIGLAAPAVAHDPKPTAPALVPLSPSAKDAAAIVDAFHAALRSGGTEAAAALLAGDALVYESGGVERSKVEYASHHLSADAEFAKAVTRAVTRQTGNASGDLAWIATEAQTSGSYKGRAIDSASTEAMILRREGNAWKISHIHWSSAK